MPDPTQRFFDHVENYVRYRPSYPAGLIQCLQARAKLDPASVVADVGAGTGILTALLLPVVGQVHAIEPNSEMRGAAEHDLGHSAKFNSVAAKAESTTLPDASVDLITAGQAFHWFDIEKTRAEFTRIIKPGGHVALIWNERVTNTSPFLIAYDHLLKTHAIDYDQVNHTRIDAAAIGGFFASGNFKIIEFPNKQKFNWTGLKGRALSSSYVPNASQPGHEEFFTRLQQLFVENAEDGKVSFQYQTRLYLGQLT